MKLQSLIATALVVTIGSALLAQTSAEKWKPAPMEKATLPRLDQFGDPLPAGAIARFGTVRFRHNGTIDCFTFSPDGKTIASCSGGTIHVWDVATGDVATGREVWRVDSDGPEYECVSTLAFSRDGKLLACCGSRGDVGRIALRDAATGKERRLFDSKDCYISSVAFAPNGKTLASAGFDRRNLRKVRLWNVETGAELHCLEGSRVVAFSPDGKILASADKAGAGIRLWDPLTGKQVGSLPSTNEGDLERDFFIGIGRIVFSADGKNLAIGSRIPYIPHPSFEVGTDKIGQFWHTWQAEQDPFTPRSRAWMLTREWTRRWSGPCPWLGPCWSSGGWLTSWTKRHPGMVTCHWARWWRCWW